MQGFKFARNVVARSVALLAIIVPAVKATAQTQPAAGVKTVLLIHGAWADGSSWSKLFPLLEAKGLHVVAVQITVHRCFVHSGKRHNGIRLAADLPRLHRRIARGRGRSQKPIRQHHHEFIGEVGRL